jgi:hypothetical protein
VPTLRSGAHRERACGESQSATGASTIVSLAAQLARSVTIVFPSSAPTRVGGGMSRGLASTASVLSFSCVGARSLSMSYAALIAAARSNSLLPRLNGLAGEEQQLVYAVMKNSSRDVSTLDIARRLAVSQLIGAGTASDPLDCLLCKRRRFWSEMRSALEF